MRNSKIALARALRMLALASSFFVALSILGCERRADPAPAPQLPALEYADAWGTRGKNPGQLESPVGIATDGFGNVFVVDAATLSVNKFSAKGEPRLSFGYATLTHPEGIAVDRGGGIYVTVESRVLVFWPEGDFLRSTNGGPRAALREASGIAVGDSGDFYVVDRAACRVEAFGWRNRFLRFLRVWGKCGSENGEFIAPSGVAVGRDGSVFVADAGGARVQEFSSEGAFVASFGQAQRPDAADTRKAAHDQTGAAAIAVSPRNIFSAGDAASPLRVWSLDGKEIPLDSAVLQAAHLTPDFHATALAYDFHNGDLLLLDGQACRVLRIHLHL
ncbi:MAG: NHL repeat-containing protein [Candidatus Acidiferrales bacterium]